MSQMLKILKFYWWYFYGSLIFLKFCKHENNKNVQSKIWFSKVTSDKKISVEFENFSFQISLDTGSHFLSYVCVCFLINK